MIHKTNLTSLFTAVCLFTAQSQTPLSFDVASIKVRRDDVTYSADPSVRGRTVIATASTLNDLITYAFQVRYEQLSGVPPWAATEHYDITAKAEGDGPLPAEQSRRMMQSLLAERFHLQVHRESRDAAIFALVVAKNGPKFKPSALDASGSASTRGEVSGAMRMEAVKTTMEQLARQLSHTAGRPVVDQTGLAGTYAFTLEWFPETRVPPPDTTIPSLRTAVHEQLGLSLEPVRGTVEMLVIDRAARPSEN